MLLSQTSHSIHDEESLLSWGCPDPKEQAGAVAAAVSGSEQSSGGSSRPCQGRSAPASSEAIPSFSVGAGTSL